VFSSRFYDQRRGWHRPGVWQWYFGSSSSTVATSKCGIRQHDSLRIIGRSPPPASAEVAWPGRMPAAVSRAPNHLDVFYVTFNGGIDEAAS